ncbi:hypothetical protein [Nonomuraea helvata]|uniref:hypothetical protein n=1 Tax=Nonomuraea helvata TaxID=37484 RepID=UPI0031E9FD97
MRVDLPFQTPIAIAPATGHVLACGFDWGLNTLLTGATGRLSGGRVTSDGRPLTYDATGVSAKLHRLRHLREHLAAKRERLQRLLAGLTPADLRHATLSRACEVLEVEHERVCTRIRNLNHALAWSAARWAVDQALTAGATVIYLEDLATLEARGRRGRANARLSGQVRGQVAEAIRHLAAKHTVTVVTVPARGISKYCPRCGEGTSPLKHSPAPDRLAEQGWTWASCPSLRAVVRPGPGGGRADPRPRPARPARHPHPPHHRRTHHRHGGGGQRRPRPPAPKGHAGGAARPPHPDRPAPPTGGTGQIQEPPHPETARTHRHQRSNDQRS